MSVKNKFPFDSILMEGRHLNVKFLKERECREGFLEMEGESSCSSFTGARLKEKNELVSIGSLNSRLMQKGVDDFKGKGVLNQRSRYGVFRRRRRALVENKQVLRRSSSPSPFGGGWAREIFLKEKKAPEEMAFEVSTLTFA
ncbi:hypothetical protein IFM89_028168 [Coptis chinensis]|uniref:Uncharacterized protein n=1 Tax=Coptis chinensis TaxID=261450 RepID=A0A835HZ44_9MAGN|nr:hypothetical protein IFM89_028168 [Coptis chinensis]